MRFADKLKDRLLMGYHVSRYHGMIIVQSLISTWITALRARPKRNWPPITIFISSLNTMWPLRLTLTSMQRFADYPNRSFHFAENSSIDGSAQYLQDFAESEKSACISSDKPRPHGLWIDHALAHAQTPYVIFVDSDILFFRGGLLFDIVDYMEGHRECWLLESDFRAGSAFPDDPEVYCPEAISTWLFCVRTSLRERVTGSFLGRYGEEKGPTGKPRYLYECGAAILQEMREKQLRYDVMPWWMRQKFYHFGNLSWIGQMTDQENRFVKMKRYQIKDIERRVQSLS